MVDVTLAVWSEALGSDYIRSINVGAWRAWADAQILSTDAPPEWLLDLSLATTAEQVQAAIMRAWREQPSRLSSERRRALDRVSLHLGLLYLRFLRGDLEVAALLQRAGDRADRTNYRIDCSAFYLLLNEIDGRGPVVPSSRPLAELIAELFEPHAEYAREQLRELPPGQEAEPLAAADRSGIMSPDVYRQSFADFLSRLATGAEREGEWSQLVVAHYPDEELEAIRRELVRLSIRRNPTGRVDAWEAEDLTQMLRWAEQLGHSPAE